VVLHNGDALFDLASDIPSGIESAILASSNPYIEQFLVYVFPSFNSVKCPGLFWHANIAAQLLPSVAQDLVK